MEKRDEEQLESIIQRNEQNSGGKNIIDENLEAQITFLSRQPFQQLLTRMLEVQPEQEDLSKWAKRDPHLWMQSVTQAAKLAGYSDQLDVTGNIAVDARNMSDLGLQDLMNDPKFLNILQDVLLQNVEEKEPALIESRKIDDLL